MNKVKGVGGESGIMFGLEAWGIMVYHYYKPPEALTQYLFKENRVEQIVKIRVEKLPGGFYLATSEEIQGLVAQGGTVTETLEIARGVARRLMEAQAERQEAPQLSSLAEKFDYPLVVPL